MLSKNKNLTHGVSADTPQLGKVVTVQIVTMLIAVISMLIDGVMTGVFLGDDSLAFQVEGLENVQKGRQYIFCPNHQTHFDGLFTWAALGDKCPEVQTIGRSAEEITAEVREKIVRCLSDV